MQVVREFRITVGSLKEKKEGGMDNGQSANMTVKTMDTKIGNCWDGGNQLH